MTRSCSAQPNALDKTLNRKPNTSPLSTDSFLSLNISPLLKLDFVFEENVFEKLGYFAKLAFFKKKKKKTLPVKC